MNAKTIVLAVIGLLFIYLVWTLLQNQDQTPPPDKTTPTPSVLPYYKPVDWYWLGPRPIDLDIGWISLNPTTPHVYTPPYLPTRTVIF